MYICTGCRREHPGDLQDYRCPHCTGLLDLARPLVFDRQRVERGDATLWRYRHTFPLPAAAEPVTLGEGGTPLIPIEIADSAGTRSHRVYLKLEYLNPTASFKDRGTTLLMTRLRHYGVAEAVEDSSGNAGASFAAYAARAGIGARVYVPAYASAGKIAQIEVFGAQAVRVEGPRSKAAEAVQQAAAAGSRYASHNYDPIGLAGLATTAYELVEQLGQAPGTVILPVGHGTLLLGLYRGFVALHSAGAIAALPRLVGVQAESCAPLWAYFHYGSEGLGLVSEGETLAEGIRILHPVRGDAVLAAVAASHGTLLTVSEVQIDAGRTSLARRGFYVEHTSAVVWQALQTTLAADGGVAPEPVVAILTGSGLKSIPGV